MQVWIDADQGIPQGIYSSYFEIAPAIGFV